MHRHTDKNGCKALIYGLPQLSNEPARKLAWLEVMKKLPEPDADIAAFYMSALSRGCPHERSRSERFLFTQMSYEHALTCTNVYSLFKSFGLH